mgnify:CR=1 FL=1
MEQHNQWSAMPSKARIAAGEVPPHNWGAWDSAHALVAHLCDDKGKVAAELGIKGVKARTTGPQLLELLAKHFLRVQVERVRDAPDPEAGNPGTNAYWKSAFDLKGVSGPQPKAIVAAKPRKYTAAQRQKRARRRKPKKPKGERRNTHTSRGNKVAKATPAAVVQVQPFSTRLPATPRAGEHSEPLYTTQERLPPVSLAHALVLGRATFLSLYQEPLQESQ